MLPNFLLFFSIQLLKGLELGITLSLLDIKQVLLISIPPPPRVLDFSIIKAKTQCFGRVP